MESATIERLAITGLDDVKMGSNTGMPSPCQALDDEKTPDHVLPHKALGPLACKVRDQEQERTVTCPAARIRFMRDVRAAGLSAGGHVWTQSSGYRNERLLDVWVVAENGRTFRLTDIVVSGDEWHSPAAVEDYRARFQRFVNFFRLDNAIWHWSNIEEYLMRCGEDADVLGIILKPEPGHPLPYCFECGRAVPFYDRTPAFGCDECGTLFNRKTSFNGNTKRCPQCHKAGSEVHYWSCTGCGAPVEEINLCWCPLCFSSMPFGEWDEHLHSHIKHG